MSNQRKQDDLAAALNAMAGGYGDGDDDAAVEQDATPKPEAAPPAAPVTRATAPRPAPRPVPAKPPAPPAVTEPVKPVRASRPSSPTNRPAAPTAPVPQAASDSPFDHAAPDDDDAVIVPAPDQSVFAPKPRTAPSPRAPRTPVYQTMQFRQTIIPVMLTGGGLCVALALARMILVNDDSIFGAVPLTIGYALLVVGLVLLAVAALNIVQVKHTLETSATPAKPGRNG
jgi:hypothetical protein